MGNWGAISPIVGGVDVSNILDPPWIKMENRLVFGFIGNWFDSYISTNAGGLNQQKQKCQLWMWPSEPRKKHLLLSIILVV